MIVHRILKEVLRTSLETMEEEVPVGTSAGSGHRSTVEERPFWAASSPSLKDGASAPDVSRAGRPRHTSTSAETNSPSPWSKRRDREAHQRSREPLSDPISLKELHEIAEESSQSERRADDAERELMEWKKVKFMEPRIGEDFDGLIISVTKYGFFVELTDLFVEGLVPLNTLTEDRYTYHENTRQIIGQRTRKAYTLGDRLRVLVDRIDPMEKKIQFAVVEELPKLPGKSRRK